MTVHNRMWSAQHHPVAQAFGHQVLYFLHLLIPLHDGVTLSVVIGYRRILQRIHDVLQFFCHDGILEVDHQHRNHFVQTFFVRYQLLCFRVIFTQLIPVACQFGGYCADSRIGVRHKETFGGELLFAASERIRRCSGLWKASSSSFRSLMTYSTTVTGTSFPSSSVMLHITLSP